MSKSKFYYDKSSLSFKEIKVSSRTKLINVTTFIFVTFIFGVISLFILLSTPYLNTPKELTQERELNLPSRLGLQFPKLKGLQRGNPH